MARVDHYRSPDAPAANRIIVAVTAFIQDDTGPHPDDRRTDNDLYAIPGGALKLGETLTQTVQREVMEETGLDVQVTGLIGIYSNPEHVIEFTHGEVRRSFPSASTPSPPEVSHAPATRAKSFCGSPTSPTWTSSTSTRRSGSISGTAWTTAPRRTTRR